MLPPLDLKSKLDLRLSLLVSPRLGQELELASKARVRARVEAKVSPSDTRPANSGSTKFWPFLFASIHSLLEEERRNEQVAAPDWPLC